MCYTEGMAKPSEIPHWKVSVQEGNERPKIEFLNALQIAARRRMGAVITGEATTENMYYPDGDGTFRRAKK